MSTTVCLAFSTSLPQAIVDNLNAIAGRYRYELVVGIDAAEKDVQEGLRQISDRLGWNCHVFLRAPVGSLGVLAFGIQEELYAYETTGTPPPFFGFLKDVDECLMGMNNAYWIVFAGEWGLNERIRLEEGSAAKLIERLSGPANWGERLYVVRAGCFQDSDEVPLVFKVIR